MRTWLDLCRNPIEDYRRRASCYPGHRSARRCSGALWVHTRDGQAVVGIRDSGIGITPDALAHIFDLFRQADEAAARSKSGLGIGLALVRNLVELHGGSVTAASAVIGQGSEFTVGLPREAL